MFMNGSSNTMPTLSTERDARRFGPGITDPTFNRHQIAFLEDVLSRIRRQRKR